MLIDRGRTTVFARRSATDMAYSTGECTTPNLYFPRIGLDIGRLLALGSSATEALDDALVNDPWLDLERLCHFRVAGSSFFNILDS
jgi:hypothetical protein